MQRGTSWARKLAERGMRPFCALASAKAVSCFHFTTFCSALQAFAPIRLTVRVRRLRGKLPKNGCVKEGTCLVSTKVLDTRNWNHEKNDVCPPPFRVQNLDLQAYPMPRLRTVHICRS